jgi:hypothetical protein
MFTVSDDLATEPAVGHFGNCNINKSNAAFVGTDDVQMKQVNDWQFLRDDEGKVNLTLATSSNLGLLVNGPVVKDLDNGALIPIPGMPRTGWRR